MSGCEQRDLGLEEGSDEEEIMSANKDYSQQNGGTRLFVPHKQSLFTIPIMHMRLDI